MGEIKRLTRGEVVDANELLDALDEAAEDERREAERNRPDRR